MPVISESEVLAKCLQEFGEKCGEVLAKCFAEFHPSISQGKWPQEISQKVLDIFSTAPNKVFHSCNSGSLGAQSCVQRGLKFVLFSLNSTYCHHSMCLLSNDLRVTTPELVALP